MPKRLLTDKEKEVARLLLRPRLRFEKSAARRAREAERARLEALTPGMREEDGSIYLGFFKNKYWFATAVDAKNLVNKNILMNFNAAAAYAKNLKAHGHDDWMVPPGQDDPHESDILSALFNNKNTGAFRNSYDASDFVTYNWYWSSTRYTKDSLTAFQRNFEDGRYIWVNTQDVASVRCVRAVRP